MRSLATIAAQLCALMIATAAACNAQAWRWGYVTRTPNSPLLRAQSSVVIDANRVHMSYTVPLQKRQVVIESCNADLHDVESAGTIRTEGTSYLLIRFKPPRAAACVSGQRPAVALPADDERLIARVAAAIERSCCAPTGPARPRTAAAATPPARVAAAPPSPEPSARPTPSPPPAPSPPPTPSPRPSPARAPLQDWVESDGLFWFVRVHNAGRVAVSPAGEVFNCRNVEAGCGPLAHVVIDPDSTATVAIIAANDRGATPTFDYRYTAGDGPQPQTGSGSVRKRPPHGAARMSARELRTAQAAALVELRTPRATPAPVVPARLVRRGSSRLGIGQTGTALVRVTIGANGTPQDVTIVSITNKQLTAAAIETAVSSTYAPALQNGRPVEAKYVATFSFDGEDPALSSIPVWKRSPAPAPSAAAATTAPAAAASAAPLPSPS